MFAKGFAPKLWIPPNKILQRISLSKERNTAQYRKVANEDQEATKLNLQLLEFDIISLQVLIAPQLISC